MKKQCKQKTVLPEHERPREKVLSKGIESLSNTELFALLIGSGTAQHSAEDLAKQLMMLSAGNLAELSRWSCTDFIKKIKGIGKAKSILICAALEIGRRKQIEQALVKKRVLNAQDAIFLLKPFLQDKVIEKFVVVFLNRANQVLSIEPISEGGYTATVVDVRVIYKKALELNATSIIVAHNHPSGNEQPSMADIQLTEQIKAAGKIMNIGLQDHIIVTNNLCYSFADNGKL